MAFLYDRGQNVTGTIPATLDYVASYGMQVNFQADLTQYTTVDNYVYMMPKGLNHLQMNATIPYSARKNEDARKIVGFFESLNGTGYFQYTDPAQIYKPINLFVNNIEDTFDVNDLHNIQVSVSSDQSSNLLNWNNNFLTGSTLKGNWATSTAYSKYDVVRHTGNASYPLNTGNLYDSFYYCTGNHTSQSSINGSEMSSGQWTQEFSFDPTYSTQISTESSVIKTDLPYSYTKRTKFGLHSNTIKSFKLDFNGISDAEARCILHFLIGQQGYKKFQYKIPRIYNQDKYFFAPQWSHTLVYKNVNNISVMLVEDPLGVRLKPKPLIVCSLSTTITGDIASLPSSYSSGGGTSTGDYMASMTIASGGTTIFSNSTLGSTSYLNLSDTLMFSISSGSTYTLSYTTGSYGQGVAAYMQDSSGTWIRIGGSSSGSATSGSFSITIPSGISGAKRFIVRSYYNMPGSNSNASNVSYTHNYGQRKDYRVCVN